MLAVAGLARELPDTDTVVLRTICRPVTHTITLGDAWPDKSLPSHEWPITGMPATPNKPLTTHRSIDRHSPRAADRAIVAACLSWRVRRKASSWLAAAGAARPVRDSARAPGWHAVEVRWRMRLRWW